MRKAVLCFVSIILIFYGNAVYAEEAYYTNLNGIEFNEYQYNTLVAMLNEHIVQTMTYEEYQNFNVDNIIEGEYFYEVIEDGSSSNANSRAYHETTCKRIVLGATCSSSECTISLSTTWKCIPGIKSYDVTGVRLANTTFSDDDFLFTYRADSTVKTSYAGKKGASNGVGYAIKIPSSGDIDYTALYFDVKPQGRVYGTYQHAVKNITLTKALDFTFNSSGYGGVFAWPSSYGQIFDQTSGVYLVLPVD